MLSPLDLRLYELFSEKTLSFGCRLEIAIWESNGINDDRISSHFSTVVVSNDYIGDEPVIFTRHPFYCFSVESINRRENKGELKILGHEPHLHNIFTLAKERGWVLSCHQIAGFEVFPLLSKPTLMDYDFCKSLLEQEEITKSQIIDLFSNN